MTTAVNLGTAPHPLVDQPILVQWVPPSLQRVLDVPISNEGLQALALQGCWRALLDKVKSIRPSDPEEVLRLTTYKVLAMCKLRMYSAAFDELNALGGFDSAQYHRQSARGPVSLVPFAMRWMNAQLPGLLGKHSYALDELYKLASYCERQQQRALALDEHHADKGTDNAPQTDGQSSAVHDASHSSTADRWGRRRQVVLFTIVNYHVRSKEYLEALEVLNSLLQQDPGDFDVWSKVGYIQLLMGDVNAAGKTFDKVKELMQSASLNDHESHDADILALLNKALFSFASNDMTGSLQAYDAVLALDPSHWLALNNKAVVTMYSCKLGNAITGLELSFATAPVDLLQEPLLLNLSSMYELHATSYRDEVKHKIGVWVSRVGPEDFDNSCMRAA